MEIFKRIVALSLVLSMTIPTFPVTAQASIIEEEEIEEFVPQNPPGTPPGVQCTQIDQRPDEHGVCCVGLERNNAGICDEPALKDNSIYVCNSDAQCGGGTGCYPQTTEYLFTDLFSTQDSPELLSEKRMALETQIADVEHVKNVGESCSHAKECSSYSCGTSGKCESVNVCRFAAEGEVAPGAIQCGPGLKKEAGVCVPDPESQNAIYVGIDNNVQFSPVGQCGFEMTEESRMEAQEALYSLRAMEWFFSTITLDRNEECFDTVASYKEIGHTFKEQRKNILANFSEVLGKIEYDGDLVMNAKKDSDETVTIHQASDGTGEQIMESDLATRFTSGYDSLMLMYRRNLLFKSLEKGMLESIQSVSPKVKALDDRLMSFTNNMDHAPCAAARYKKKRWFKWRTRNYTKTKDYWAWHYEVKGDAQENMSFIKKPSVSKTLALVSDKTPEAAIADFTRSKYYLMDPMTFGGTNHSSFGTDKRVGSDGSWHGLSGFKDLRKAKYLNGTGRGSLTYMRTTLRNNIESFYRDLKRDSAQTGFVFEPEIITTAAKDCLDPQKKTEQCSEFDRFLDEVTDRAMAYYLAYGYSMRPDYNNYFTNHTTYRRKLLNEIYVNMEKISNYYSELMVKRDSQNACIDLLLNGLSNSGILDGGGGVLEGNHQSPWDVPGLNGVVDAQTGSNVRSGAFSPLTRSKYEFDLSTGSLSNLYKSNLSDGAKFANGSSGKAGLSSTGGATLASKVAAMLEANKKAKAAGVDLSSKQKAYKDTISSMAKSNSNKNASAGSNSSLSAVGNFASRGSGSGSLDHNGAGSAQLGSDLKGAGELGLGQVGHGSLGSGAVGEGKAGAQGDLNSGTIAIGGNGNAIYDSYGSENANGSGSDAANARKKAGKAGAGGSDRTGTLSGADRDRVFSEYERTKSEYDSSADDGLFSKVSKAYVRNLDKVLAKKKKLEE